MLPIGIGRAAAARCSHYAFCEPGVDVGQLALSTGVSDPPPNCAAGRYRQNEVSLGAQQGGGGRSSCIILPCLARKAAPSASATPTCIRRFAATRMRSGSNVKTLPVPLENPLLPGRSKERTGGSKPDFAIMTRHYHGRACADEGNSDPNSNSFCVAHYRRPRRTKSPHRQERRIPLGRIRLRHRAPRGPADVQDDLHGRLGRQQLRPHLARRGSGYRHQDAQGLRPWEIRNGCVHAAEADELPPPTINIRSRSPRRQDSARPSRRSIGPLPSCRNGFQRSAADRLSRDNPGYWAEIVCTSYHKYTPTPPSAFCFFPICPRMRTALLTTPLPSLPASKPKTKREIQDASVEPGARRRLAQLPQPPLEPGAEGHARARAAPAAPAVILQHAGLTGSSACARSSSEHTAVRHQID